MPAVALAPSVARPSTTMILTYILHRQYHGCWFPWWGQRLGDSFSQVDYPGIHSDHFVPTPANGRCRYIVTSPLIGWAHAQNDPSIKYQGVADVLVTRHVSFVAADDPVMKGARTSATLWFQMLMTGLPFIIIVDDLAMQGAKASTAPFSILLCFHESFMIQTVAPFRKYFGSGSGAWCCQAAIHYLSQC